MRKHVRMVGRLASSNKIDMAEEFVKDALDKYKNFVIKNPILSSELEVALKWMSYVAAGRFTQSSVVSELVHTASNLITLVNDIILRKAANLPIHSDATVEKLRTLLGIIEYSEVFTEIAALRIFGRKSRWLVIIIVHLVKSAIRLLLIVKFKNGLMQFPPVPPLKRQQDVPQLCGKDVEVDESLPSTNVEVTFTLKRSRRVIRTLESAPPLVSRTWKLPQNEASCLKSASAVPTELTKVSLQGEILHLLRPLVHLIMMGRFGESSWKPWLISLGMDATSLHLLRKNTGLNYSEKVELNRRAFSLLVYLLRSPFYSRFSKLQIMYMLKTVANNVPGTGFILRPMMEYIPEWQQIYFYTWAL